MAVAWDGEGIHATHEEIMKWIDWYNYRIKGRGANDGQANAICAQIVDFLSSGEDYAKASANAGPKCPACNGRGVSGLVLIGATKPQPCSACEGSGVFKLRVAE